jgi:hypothetical protein
MPKIRINTSITDGSNVPLQQVEVVKQKGALADGRSTVVGPRRDDKKT